MGMPLTKYRCPECGEHLRLWDASDVEVIHDGEEVMLDCDDCEVFYSVEDFDEFGRYIAMPEPESLSTEEMIEGLKSLNL